MIARCWIVARFKGVTTRPTSAWRRDDGQEMPAGVRYDLAAIDDDDNKVTLRITGDQFTQLSTIEANAPVRLRCLFEERNGRSSLRLEAVESAAMSAAK